MASDELDKPQLAALVGWPLTGGQWLSPMQGPHGRTTYGPASFRLQ